MTQNENELALAMWYLPALQMLIVIVLQAVLDDNLVMVRLLIQHGAKINKKDEDGWTPLHAAAANGLPHIARYEEGLKERI